MERVLVLNAGSSSVKYQLIDLVSGDRIAGGSVEAVTDVHAAFNTVVEALDDHRVDAIGHRVVHGGTLFSTPIVIDAAVIEALRELIPLAPLHNPANIEGIEIARRLWPDDPQVAVFDTAFHSTLPPRAYRYAIPEAWYRDHGVRRYGFHGTSHAVVAQRAADVLGRPLSDVRLITAHLGNGASMAAIDCGRSVDTSMGLSPLEGLVMGTRSGDLDPAVVEHLVAATGRSVTEVVDDLNHASGLLGVSGDSDMRTILDRRASGDVAATLAFDVFVYRIKKYIGAYLAVLGGCDALVFTGGIGEHSPDVRAAACADLEEIGFVVDAARNEAGESRISADESSIEICVIPTDEERSIAEQTASLIVTSGE
ncbi:MAG: acetate kinase [Ilumatobacteraceae bacterium]|nr:acetate kinase [Ilumatobacteraceae bacterium]